MASIVHSALILFQKNGFAGTTIAALAAHAHVSKRTIYEHFSAKENIFGEVVRRNSGLLIGLPRPVSEDLPIRDGLSAVFLLDLSPEEQQARTALLDLIVRESLSFPLLNAHLYDGGIINWRQQLVHWLLQEQARGKIQFDDADICAGMLLNIVHGAIQPRRRNAASADFSGHRRNILGCFDIFLRGCAS